jgi:hypothetical protein
MLEVYIYLYILRVESRPEPALGRMAYLKLKFEKVEFAATILTQNGISFTWSPQGRKAAIYSRLDPSVLDDVTGRPRPEYREKDGDYLEASCSGNPARGLHQGVPYRHRCLS